MSRKRKVTETNENNEISTANKKIILSTKECKLKLNVSF